MVSASINIFQFTSIWKILNCKVVVNKLEVRTMLIQHFGALIELWELLTFCVIPKTFECFECLSNSCVVYLCRNIWEDIFGWQIKNLQSKAITYISSLLAYLLFDIWKFFPENIWILLLWPFKLLKSFWADGQGRKTTTLFNKIVQQLAFCWMSSSPAQKPQKVKPMIMLINIK